MKARQVFCCMNLTASKRPSDRQIICSRNPSLLRVLLFPYDKYILTLRLCALLFFQECKIKRVPSSSPSVASIIPDDNLLRIKTIYMYIVYKNEVKLCIQMLSVGCCLWQLFNDARGYTCGHRTDVWPVTHFFYFDHYFSSSHIIKNHVENIYMHEQKSSWFNINSLTIFSNIHIII